MLKNLGHFEIQLVLTVPSLLGSHRPTLEEEATDFHHRVHHLWHRIRIVEKRKDGC